MSAKGSLAKDLLDAGLDREHVDRRIRDFRREVLREAAERQRSAAHIAKLIDMSPEDAVHASADMIDPEAL